MRICIPPGILLSTAWHIASAGPVIPTELIEQSCSFLISYDGTTSKMVGIPDLSVLHPPREQPKFVVEELDGAKLEAVVCWRSRAEFSMNDYRIVEAGFPLYIKTDTGDPARDQTLVLELSGVGHRIRMISGPNLNPEEQEQATDLIETFNLRLLDR